MIGGITDSLIDLLCNTIKVTSKMITDIKNVKIDLL